MRDWMIVIIVLLIAGIVLDGVRRWRIARREELRLSRNVVKADKEFTEDRPASSEFPSGGARVALQRDIDDAVNKNNQLKETYVSSRVTVGAPNRIPEQVTLNLDEAVPMLMDSVELDEDDVSVNGHKEPVIGNVENLEDLDSVGEATAAQTYGRVDAQHTKKSAAEETIADKISAEKDSIEKSSTGGHASENLFAEGANKSGNQNHNDQKDAAAANVTSGSAPVVGTASSKKIAPETAAKPVKNKQDNVAQKQQKVEPNVAAEAFIEPEEVLIFNVMAHAGQRFSGGDLLTALMQQKMKFGEMDIFHRHAHTDGSGPVLFSLANMVVPGTFNLAAMKDFSTPGVSLFLSLPLPDSLALASESASLDAYNILAATAQGLARALDGELKDENRSVMTLQTIEHGRQRVIEYQRKCKLARA